MPPVTPDGAFIVDFRSMNSCADAIKQASKIINDITNDLEGGAAKSLAYWEDTAKDAYIIAKANWDQACLEMNSVLNSSSNTLLTINDNFIRTETGNTAMWNK